MVKAYGVINWLNKNLKTNIGWCREKKSSFDIKTWSIDRILTPILKKYAESVHQSDAQDPFLIMVNGLQQPMHVTNSFE